MEFTRKELKLKALIVDTETNGLIDNHSVKLDRQPHIIEYFSCTTDLAKGERLNELEQLIRPPVKLSKTITDITGIDDSTVATAPVFSEISGAIRSNIETAEVVIAHNMSFDREMLNVEFERIGTPLRWPRVICTVEASLHYRGFRLNLQGLHEYLFNEKFEGHHRARPDVEALERICIEMFKRGDL